MPTKKTLKELSEITSTGKLKGAIPSGFKSGDSLNELMVVEPLMKHPEIAGLYRAIDPETGWKGWVEYTPPSPPVVTPPDPAPPTPEQVKREELGDKMRELKKRKSYVDLGLIDAKDIAPLQAEVKQILVELGEV